jgi:hypothetical protein
MVSEVRVRSRRSIVPVFRLPLQGLRSTGRFDTCSDWWAAVDSNHLPPRYQHGALPVELAALVAVAGAEGFEPSTLGFGDRCSDQTELRPWVGPKFSVR